MVNKINVPSFRYLRLIGAFAEAASVRVTYRPRSAYNFNIELRLTNFLLAARTNFPACSGAKRKILCLA